MTTPRGDGAGIVGVGVYLPYHRLERRAIAETLGTPPTPGARSVASFDEDSTTMGVEALRSALAAAPAFRPEQVLFASTSPAYEDKTNATVVHAAAGLDRAAFAGDLCGALRSGIGALRLALDSATTSSVVLGDVRTGLPGSEDERRGGDAASAVLVGRSPDQVIATLVAQASATTEFLDRWRGPGDDGARVWEERFGEHAYLPLAADACSEALAAASLSAADVDHLAVVGLHERAARLAVGRLGVKSDAVVDTHQSAIGNSATAMIGIALAAALRRARPGEYVVLLSLADGADAFVFRATEALRASALPDLPAMIDTTSTQLSYGKYLTWRGLLVRDPPRRPDLVPPASPPALRSVEWKYGFVASECSGCATVHAPPQRVCLGCGATDTMVPRPLADAPATLATYTIDHLALSVDPPTAVGVVDFEGGGRYRCEITDCDPDTLAVGDRLEMTFRRAYTAKGIHNYVWKARPMREKA